MKITPLDIVSAIAIASISLRMLPQESAKGKRLSRGKTLKLRRQNQAVPQQAPASFALSWTT